MSKTQCGCRLKGCEFPYQGIDKDLIKKQLDELYVVNTPYQYKPDMREFYENLVIESRVYKLFILAGELVFPERSLENAARIVQLPIEVLEQAIKNKELFARKTPGGQVFIRLWNLWHFAKDHEKRRLLSLRPDLYPYNQSELAAGNTVAERFQKAGAKVDTEVTAYRADQILRCPV